MVTLEKLTTIDIPIIGTLREPTKKELERLDADYGLELLTLSDLHREDWESDGISEGSIVTAINDIKIKSDFGKYNSENFDTIFSKNVIIDYLDNNILGEYLDFSIKRNSMIMSREIVYTNLNNILKADAIEIDIDTKDTKIYMFQVNKKVNIRSKK